MEKNWKAGHISFLNVPHVGDYNYFKEMSLKTVKVNKSDLIRTVRDNRDIHYQEYEETKAEYLEAVKTALDKVAEKVHKDNEVDLTELYDLPKPVSHVDAYDQVLSLLEWEVEAEISLDANEFRNYVLDEWGWKQEMEYTKSSLSLYNTGVNI